MTVDLSKIKPGDEVLIRATVDDRATPPFSPLQHVAVKLGDDGFSLCTIRASLIAGHTPKALAVGDRVETHSSTGEGRILAIHAGCAWVGAADDETFPPRTFSLGELERVS